MFEPLTHQVAHGQYAAAELRAADNMMSTIAQWDLLRYSEKMHEWEKGARSRFSQVPGFEPRWCGVCLEETFPDYRNDPEGECPVCGAWGGQSQPTAA